MNTRDAKKKQQKKFLSTLFSLFFILYENQHIPLPSFLYQTFFHKEEEEENRNLKFYCDVSVRKKLWKNIFNAI